MKLPTGMDVPVYVKDDFPRFLQGDVHAAGDEGKHERDLHRVRVGHGLVRSVRGRSAVEPTSCGSSACSGSASQDSRCRLADRDGLPIVRPRPQDVFITRLHVRYDAAHFPEDLVFQETADRTNFQGRYVLRHAWKGERLVRGRRPLSRRAAAAPRARGADAGVADRLGHQRDPQGDGPGQRRTRTGPGEVVAEDLERLVNGTSASACGHSRARTREAVASGGGAPRALRMQTGGTEKAFSGRRPPASSADTRTRGPRSRNARNPLVLAVGANVVDVVHDPFTP